MAPKKKAAQPKPAGDAADPKPAAAKPDAKPCEPVKPCSIDG